MNLKPLSQEGFITARLRPDVSPGPLPQGEGADIKKATEVAFLLLPCAA